jgi:hypothetical protein
MVMSWDQLAEMDVFGTSPFQNLCCRNVARLIPDVVFEEKGTVEKYFVAEVPIIDIKACVYLDSAEIISPSLNIRFDRANARTPGDLTLQLIKALSNAF